MVETELLQAHERASSRFADVIESMPTEPRPVPGLTWTTIEVAAHVLSVLRAYQRCVAEGEPLWRNALEGPAENQRLLAATPERESAELARAIRTAADGMRAAVANVPGPLRVFGEVQAAPAIVIGVNLGDVLIHGLDVCRGLGQRWTIDGADAMVVLDALLQIAPGFVDQEGARGLTASYGVSLRNGSAWTIACDDGTVTVTPGRPARADCRMSASPVGMLLSSYGRQSPLRTALSGQVVAYGRKPWLAFRFNQLFVSP